MRETPGAIGTTGLAIRLQRSKSKLLSAMLYLATLLLLLQYSYTVVSLLATTGPTQFDDTYMFARYAHNLLAGYGMAWNSGEGSVLGPTSLLYTLLVAAALRVSSLPAGLLLPLLSWAATLPLFGVLWALGARHLRSPQLRYPGITPLILAMQLCIDPGMRYHALTGMDTTLALLCNALLLFATLELLRRPGRAWAVALAACAYLTVLARPDNGIYALGIPLFSILLLLPTQRREALLWFGSALACLLMLDAGAKLLVFGDLLPLSVYVKRSGFYAGYAGLDKWNPFNYLAYIAFSWLPLLFILALCGRKRHLPLLAALFVPVLLTFSYYFSVVQIMGFKARYYYPALPIIIVAALLILDDVLVAEKSFGRLPDLILRAFSVFLVLTLPLIAPSALPSAAAPPVLAPQVLYPAPHSMHQLPYLERWKMLTSLSTLAEQLPTGTIIAASEVGVIGAAAPQAQIIDLAGLNDRQMAHHGFSADYIFDRRPDIIWLPETDYIVLRNQIMSDPRFSEHYSYYPGAYNFGLAIRNDSPYTTHIEQLVAASWAQTYPKQRMADYRIVQGHSCRVCN